MTRDATSTARSYFETWNANDFDAPRARLADDASFEGPLGRGEQRLGLRAATFI